MFVFLWLFKNSSIDVGQKYSHKDVKIILADRIYFSILFRSLCDPGAL